MSYKLIISERLDSIFSKLAKKDKLQYEILIRKLNEITTNPFQKKPLTGNMAGQWRTHIRNFVLTYEIREAEKSVILLDYDHHDTVYKKSN